MSQALRNPRTFAPGETLEAISAHFLRRLHMKTLPPSVVSSRVRRTRSPGRRIKEPGGTQLCVSVEARLCRLTLSCYLMQKKVAVESLLLFLTLGHVMGGGVVGLNLKSK